MKLGPSKRGTTLWIWGIKEDCTSPMTIICQSKCTRRCRPPPPAANLGESKDQMGPPPVEGAGKDEYVPGDRVR